MKRWAWGAEQGSNGLELRHGGSRRSPWLGNKRRSGTGLRRGLTGFEHGCRNRQREAAVRSRLLLGAADAAAHRTIPHPRTKRRRGPAKATAPVRLSLVSLRSRT